MNAEHGEENVQNKHMQMKEQVPNITSTRKKPAKMLYQAYKNCSKQTTF